MIISHEHKYLFVEIPLTGSWAIRQELCEHYGGIPIVHKHATYPEFRKSPEAAMEDYYVFATVRNPLDKLVSRYFKLKTDHRGAFSDPKSAELLLTDYSDHKKYEFVKNSDASFQQYLHRYYHRPYSDLVDVSSETYSFVIRYENLQEDFSQVLRALGLDQVRPVPVVNPTQGREAEWISYYAVDVIEHAKDIVGPFMQKWGYEFPSEWGEPQVSRLSQLEFRLFCWLREIYLTNFRYDQGILANSVRRLRGRLIH